MSDLSNAPTPADPTPPAPTSPAAPAGKAKDAAAETRSPGAHEPSTPTVHGQDDQAGAGTDAPRKRRRRRRRRRLEGPPNPDGTPQEVESGPADQEGTEASAEPKDRFHRDRGPREHPRRERKTREGKPGHGAPGHQVQPKRNKKQKSPQQRQHSEHHAMTAIRALSAMADGLLAVEGIDLLSRPRFVEIPLRVPLDVRRDGARAASFAIEQILKRVQEVRAHESALVPGSVYCYFNESAKVGTSRPTEPRQVFDGYGSTGRPVFADFVTMAIERKDANIDALLAGEDVVLTHVTMGRILRTQQLAEFGKQSQVYQILGQVDAGLFATLGSDRKVAFSFQLLRGTTLEGKPRLRIHPVGFADLMDLADPAVALVLSRFQQRLDVESLRLAGQHASGKEVQEEEFVLPLLQDLARQLSAMARRSNRRTHHAEKRTEEGGRPTTKAYADAREAGDPELWIDEVENTVVVLGPKMRVHVFSLDAMHVTSLVMATPAIARRRQQGRWREAEPAERGRFRIGLRRRLQEEETAESGETKASLAPLPPPVPPEHGNGQGRAGLVSPSAAAEVVHLGTVPTGDPVPPTDAATTPESGMEEHTDDGEPGSGGSAER